MQKILVILILTLLSSCSSYNNAFECKVGKGINCTSVSKINTMVDLGTLDGSLENTSPQNVKKETIRLANNIPFPYVLPHNLHNSMVERIPETTLKIWVAPYVSATDGYIEAQYVHEVLAKGAWVDQRG